MYYTKSTRTVGRHMFAPTLCLVLALGCDSDEATPSVSGPPGAMVQADTGSIGIGDFVAQGGSTVGTTPVTGGLGVACNSDSDCATPMRCNIDEVDYIGHKQCTISCTASSTCENAFGAGSFCIGAGICVRGCDSQSDCPSLTECDFDWCIRQGAGSGIPACRGTPSSCYSSGLTCISTLGCRDTSSCSGVATSCYSRSSYNCTSLSGCSWSYSTSTCSGVPTSCSSIYTSSTCTSMGCSWTPSCSGTPTPCASLTSSSCSEQPGCYVVSQ